MRLKSICPQNGATGFATPKRQPCTAPSIHKTLYRLEGRLDRRAKIDAIMGTFSAFTAVTDIACPLMLDGDPGMPSSEERLEFAVDRILRIWSMIKQVPEPDLLELRATLLADLSPQQDLSENELVVAGLKILYGT